VYRLKPVNNFEEHIFRMRLHGRRSERLSASQKGFSCLYLGLLSCYFGVSSPVLAAPRNMADVKNMNVMPFTLFVSLSSEVIDL
jgi:hypothetical protein